MPVTVGFDIGTSSVKTVVLEAEKKKCAVSVFVRAPIKTEFLEREGVFESLILDFVHKYWDKLV